LSKNEKHSFFQIKEKENEKKGKIDFSFGKNERKKFELFSGFFWKNASQFEEIGSLKKVFFFCETNKNA